MSLVFRPLVWKQALGWILVAPIGLAAGVLAVRGWNEDVALGVVILLCAAAFVFVATRRAKLHLTPKGVVSRGPLGATYIRDWSAFRNVVLLATPSGIPRAIVLLEAAKMPVTIHLEIYSRHERATIPRWLEDHMIPFEWRQAFGLLKLTPPKLRT